MARDKERWKAVLTAVGVRLHHTYSAGVRERTAARYEVVSMFALSREPGRYVDVELTPREARELAGMLTEQADRAERLNREYGYGE